MMGSVELSVLHNFTKEYINFIHMHRLQLYIHSCHSFTNVPIPGILAFPRCVTYSDLQSEDKEAALKVP